MDKHQQLMDDAYKLFDVKDNGINNHSDLISYLANLDDKQMIDAVVIGNMNYQVENGGWEQWVYNGYCTSYIHLVDALERVDTHYANKVLDMLNIVAERLSNDVLDGNYSNSGIAGEYLNEQYSQHEEECEFCNGSGEIEDEMWNEETEEYEDTIVSCDECGCSGVIYYDEDLNYGSLSDEYYEFNEKFMKELQNYFK